MTPHLNCLDKAVQIIGHNICVYAELAKIIPNYHQILTLIKIFGNSQHDKKIYKAWCNMAKTNKVAHVPSKGLN